MVTMSGRRLRRLSLHSALNSSLWFFFITMALRKGDMSSTVARPQIPFAHQCMPGITLRMNGRKNVNISAIVAADSME